MTPYEQLREVVYKIKYPDGIPLEFGCEVVQKYYGKKTNHIITEHYRGGWAESYWNTVDGEKINDEDIFIILGKPLQLQDILWALGIRGNMQIHSNGMLLDNNTSESYLLPLDKDPKDYDEETLLALLELLK